MPSTANRYYNNPALGQAFSNLAAAFAPPSGSDLAGYATAGATREKADRLRQMFEYANDPNFSWEQADRYGVLGGLFTPNQTLEAVDRNNATQRYGYDTQAATSRANNAADNVRALEQTRLGNTKDITTSLLAPVGENETRFVPPSIADMYGLPETQGGNIAAAQGERIVTPDGRVIEGADKPLSESEWEAFQKQRLLDSGQLTDQMLLDTVLGEQTPVKIVGPDGKTPVFASPGAAVREGAEAYDSTGKALVEGTAMVNGKAVPVFRQPNESAYHTADGTPVPPGVQVFDRARPVGTADQVQLRNTEFSDKNGIFYNRAAQANAAMGDVVGEGYVPSVRDFELILGGAGDKLPTSISNQLVSDEGRKFYNSAMSFMMSVLRPDTGAAFGREEFNSYAKVFIPMPGDDPETLKAKAIARQTALAALQGTSRGAADTITKLMIAQGVPVPDEMLRAMARAQENPVTPEGAAAAPSADPAAVPLPAAPAAPARLKFDENGNLVQ